jgi:hypothetical protein
MDTTAEEMNLPEQPVHHFDLKLPLRKPKAMVKHEIKPRRYPPYFVRHVAVQLTPAESKAMQYLVEGLEAEGALEQFRKSRMTAALVVRAIVRKALEKVQEVIAQEDEAKAAEIAPPPEDPST